MVSHILDLNYSNNPQLENLFKSIAEGNTILFLGAGASVSDEKKFLSQDIIDFYEDKKQISWDIKDITEFVEALSDNPLYSRDEFDNYVDQCLRRLKVTPAHYSIAKCPWRVIFTTNFDLLIEKAFTEIEGTHNEISKLKVVHTSAQYNSIQAVNEVKYVKLHGCISDKKKYKLAFTSDDFKSVDKFYRYVLNDLKNISDRVTFLSVGYSYSDEFSKKLLTKIDSFNFREKRIIYNVDPYVNDAVLATYAQKNICIIKAKMGDFFNAYEQWRQEKQIVIKLNGAHFTNPQDRDLYIPPHITKRIGDNLKQLNSFYKSRMIPEIEYYKGEEPNYNIILKNYDVVKNKQLLSVKEQIIETLNTKANNSQLIPIFFLTGTFGTGKSTFAYRLMHKLNSTEEPTTSFETYDPSELLPIDLKEIFTKTGSRYIFLYVNTAEVNSVFKSLLDLRNKLSIETSPEIKIAFLSSIRENVYSKLTEGKEIKNSFIINVDCTFTLEEVEELVEKLKNSGTISYRDINEKKSIIEKIVNEYSGDSYISLLELVQGNKLQDDLLEAYHQLGDKCKTAFIYTSLLYQYKLMMPAGLLKSLVSGDWDKFRVDVIEKDGKGILLQEMVASKGTDPDLYFRTKHPIISKKLISILLKDEEDRFKYIKSIVTHLISGFKNSRLLINLLKAIGGYKDLTYNKIDNLYDLADNQLFDDSYFLLYYAINLQRRGSEIDIKKAIDKIRYAESISENKNRNHYLIHRRGVLTFELAKITLARHHSSEYYKVLKYISEAKDFLEIKRALDPFSSFSYYDLLNLEIWCLERLEELPNVKLKRRIQIEELFDIALRTVYEHVNRILEIKNKYIENHRFENDENAYLQYLEDYYNDGDSRPYALILLFNFYLAKNNIEKCESYLYELESLVLNHDVARLLLKYYGRNLFDMSTRVKYFTLVKTNPQFEDSENLRLCYFNFIAECYNRNFRHAYKFLETIKNSFHYINPDFHQVWIDELTNEPALFEATLKINQYGKKQLYISELHLWIRSSNWDNQWQVSMNFDVEIHFYIYGLRAKAINIITDEYEDEPLANETYELS